MAIALRVKTAPRWFLGEVARQLSKFSVLRMVLRGIYFWELKLAVICFSLVPEMVAVILRRKEVLQDGYPGDSDLDLTCVFAKGEDRFKSLRRFLYANRLIRWICPMLGETRFAEEKDFALHLVHCYPDYGASGSLEILAKSPKFSPKQITPELRSLPFRIVSSFKDSLWPQSYGIDPQTSGEKTFSRGFLKRSVKVGWFADLASERETVELNYDNHFLQHGALLITPADRRREVRRRMRLTQSSVQTNADVPRVTVHRKGQGNAVPDPLLAAIRSVLSPLFQEFPDTFTKAEMFDERPYQFQKSIVIQSHELIDFENRSEILVALADCNRQLRTLPLGLTPSCILPLAAAEWNFLMRGDSIGCFFYEAGNTNLLTGEWAESSGEAMLSRWDLQRELSDTINLIHSVPRRQDSNYLMDLIFGQLIPYRLILENGIFYRSYNDFKKSYIDYQEWTPAQRELLQLYEERRLSELDQHKTLSVWHAFAALLELEIEQAQSVLSR